MIATLIIILNLIVLEGLLSVDNAAVLATMVKDLPQDQRKRALSWGIWGAYILRGACLLIAGLLVSLWWLKILGGLYLAWLCISHFTSANDSIEENVDKGQSKIFYYAQKWFGLSAFWATIVLVEVMDLVFSIDNIFAAVALSDRMWVIVVGVFIGIAAMRLVAGWFLSLMEKHPSLAVSAYIVIGLLGLKLVLAGLAVNWFPSLNHLLENHKTDFYFSGGMMVIFFFPFIKDWLKAKLNTRTL
jgi:YkoY family integral membrane protein